MRSHSSAKFQPAMSFPLGRMVASSVGAASGGPGASAVAHPYTPARGLRTAPDDDPRRVEVRDVARGSTRRRPPVDLAEAGYMVPHWPRPWGLDADPIHQIVIDDELRRAGVSPAVQPDRHRVGRSDAARGRHRGAEGALPDADWSGEDIWCQLFSEPGAGSDLAALGHPGGARRRRVGGQRPEDLDLARHTTPATGSSSPAPTPTRRSTTASPTSSARWTPGHRDPPDHRDDRRSTPSTRCS